jgi:hypothetical protein
LAFALTSSNGEDVASLPIPLDVVALQIRGDFVSFLSPEASQGNRDLNGDGDTTDFVLHIADLSSLTTRNTRLSGTFAYRSVYAPLFPSTDGRVIVPVRESLQGNSDLNRDGDTRDMVLQSLDLRAGQARNTGIAVATEPMRMFGPNPVAGGFFEFPLLVRGQGFVSFLVAETTVDLNSDGDLTDRVLHLLDIETSTLTNTGLAGGSNVPRPILSFDSDFAFAGTPDFAPFGSFLPLGNEPVPAGPGIGDAYAFLVSEADQGNVDLNGDGDTDDQVVFAARLTDRDRNGRFDFAEAGPARAP